MPADLQSRSQYLVLAEFCQTIIDALSDYRDGTVGLPKKILENARQALQAVKDGNTYQFGQRPATALGGYEQVRTLEQVFRSPDEALQLIKSMLADQPTTADQKTSNHLIHLFTRLQTKALWNFEQPTPSVSPDVGQLCKAFETA